MDVERRPASSDWHAMPAEQVLERLEARLEGLTDAEAEARLARFGPHALPRARPRPAWRRRLAQFANVLMLVVEAEKGLLRRRS
ncbi:hypothetical protein LG302_10525 [Halomonas organivorans]